MQNNSTNTFGVWKLIAYEDRGAATQINTDDLFILGDGTPYFSLEDGLSGSSESALASYLSLQDSSKYNLTVDTSFEDTFDGSISKKTGLSISATYVMQNIVVGYKAPEENPTGLTYDDCYPEQYYFVHLTGSFQESPVKKSDDALADLVGILRPGIPEHKSVLPGAGGAGLLRAAASQTR